MSGNQTDYAIVAPPIPWASESRNGHGNIGGGMEGGETRRLTNIEIRGRNPFKHYFGDFLPIPIYFTPANGETILAGSLNAPGIIGCIAVLMEEDETEMDEPTPQSTPMKLKLIYPGKDGTEKELTIDLSPEADKGSPPGTEATLGAA